MFSWQNFWPSGVHVPMGEASPNIDGGFGKVHEMQDTLWNSQKSETMVKTSILLQFYKQTVYLFVYFFIIVVLREHFHDYAMLV